jgi:hypothetical protein
MKNIYDYTLRLLTIALALSACGAGARKGGADTDARTRAESKFNPMGTTGDWNVVTSNVPPARELDDSDTIPQLPPKAEIDSTEDMFFSVQLFASKSNSEARDFMDSVAHLFDEDVRIDYQAPYYRVCVGLTESFEQAETLLKKVNSKGYPKAWLVRIRK